MKLPAIKIRNIAQCSQRGLMCDKLPVIFSGVDTDVCDLISLAVLFPEAPREIAFESPQINGEKFRQKNKTVLVSVH